jgi:hypothetical protein
MSVAPAGVSNVLVAVSGVLQDPSTYGVSGTTLTFSAAPPSGTGNISCRYLGVPVTGVTTTAYRTVTEFTATAGQTTFTPPSYTVGFINVYLNGVLLGSADYTASNGTTVVLATGASAGNLVTVESFLVSSVLNAIPNTAGAVSSSNIVDGAITTAKIADANVTTAKIASSVSLTTPTLVTPTVTNNLTFGTSDAGIVFNKSSGYNNSTLNDYEVGTFTATLIGLSSAPSTPVTTSCGYVKVGRMVTVNINFSNVNTTGASGAMIVQGLPFVCDSTYAQVGSPPMLYSLPSVQNYTVWYVTSNTLNAYSVGNGTGWAQENISAGTGKYVWTTVCYTTSA